MYDAGALESPLDGWKEAIRRSCMAQEKPVRCEVVFTGTVQGVGFRYSARLVAISLPVSGYVENTRDGSVHLVAEGMRSSVSTLIQEILAKMQGNIRNHDERWGEATGEFPDFTIRQNRR